MFLINGFKAGKERLWSKNYQKTMFLAFLILLCAGATWYFHFIQRSEVVFSHLFYIPIGLAGLWWGRRGAWVGVLLGALLLTSHFLSALGTPFLADVIRSVMFVVVGLTVGIVREWSLLAEKALRKAHDELEGRVEERTAELTKLNKELRREITERVRAEEALGETRDYLEKLINYANAPIIVWDPGFRIIQFNHAFEHLTGYTASQVIGQELRILFPEASREESLNKIVRTLRGEYWEVVEIPILRRDGSTRLALWNSANIYAEDGTTLLATIAQGTDITDRKRAEEELRKHREHLEELVEERTAELAVAKERAEAADRLKSVFLATMSHELRTPLNSIIGFTGIMLQGLAGPLNDEQTKQLGMVQNSARHLLNLINDVLDISKIEADQLEIVAEPFDMRQAIEKVVRTVTPLAEKKGLALVAEMTPEVGQIVSDRRRVQQILINLLNNAVKFTEKGRVSIICQVNDDWLVTHVVDTGIGIKPEDMRTLFEPFRQIDTGLARQHEGTGLGLSICKKLVGMLGGEIWVESEWGVGSTFTFTLPMKRRR
jgi:PAS domain S-box-containing protein